jgi:flagellar export protein FliJ
MRPSPLGEGGKSLGKPSSGTNLPPSLREVAAEPPEGVPMKKFAFSLQVLLHLKESLEKQERNNLGLITRRLNELLSGREEMVRRRETANQTWSEKLSEGMEASETQQFTLFFRMIKELVEEQDKKIKKTQDELETCRLKLVEVMREIHMLENLKQKQYTQYLQEVQIEEEKTIGDFVSYQSAKKPAG